MRTCAHPRKSVPWHRQTFKVPQWPLTLPASISNYSDVQWCTTICPRLHVVARLYCAAIVTPCYAPIIPNMPLWRAMPFLLCWMLYAELALSKSYLEQDFILAISCFYDGLCCVVVNSGVLCQEPCTNVRPVPTLHGVVIAKATSCACLPKVWSAMSWLLSLTFCSIFATAKATWWVGDTEVCLTSGGGSPFVKLMFDNMFAIFCCAIM